MTNSELKYYEKLKHKKYRDEENKFLIEGVHLIEECLKSDLYHAHIEKIFFKENFKDEDLIKRIYASHSNAEIVVLENKKFSKLSETENPQGVIAAVNNVSDISSLKSKIQNQKSEIVIALDLINDPGNLGTIIRTCHWFGVDKILISKNSADIYNSKVIRSSQGALFHVEVISEVDMIEELKNLKKNNFDIILTDRKANKYLSNINLDKNKNYVFVFGNEAKGISKAISEDKNYTTIKIKGFTDCESLNIAVSAGIVINQVRNVI